MFFPRRWWGGKAYECPSCGWQGMRQPRGPTREATCPDCGESMPPRSWMDTWGLTLLILASVVALVLFAAYLGRR